MASVWHYLWQYMGDTSSIQGKTSVLRHYGLRGGSRGDQKFVWMGDEIIRNDASISLQQPDFISVIHNSKSDHKPVKLFHTPRQYFSVLRDYETSG